jgi:hypothetical protein
MVTPATSGPRRFEFTSTPAVLTARARGSFVPCPVCDADNERYLFHKLGVRFVRCRSCGLVYANPPATASRPYFDVIAAGQHERPKDRALFDAEVADIVKEAAAQFERRRGRTPRDIVLVGRVLDDTATPTGARAVKVIRFGLDETERLSRDGDVGPILQHLDEATDVLILNEVLEACPRGALVMSKLTSALADGAFVAVVFSNVGSFPARVLRRYWPRYFAWKSVYFDTENLTKLMDRVGLRLVGHERRPTAYTLSYIAERLTSKRPAAPLLDRTPLGSIAVRLPAGTSLAVYEKQPGLRTTEMLSVVVPVFNEATYVGPVLDALLAKKVSIPKEVIVVESNSTDGTREIVRAYEGADGLRVVYEDKPRGKGSAVRRGLAEARGSIFLIQDADFEYDLDDYDALLEPILQRRASFVLGSRSLGLDDWKVRRYASSKVKAFLMNFAQVMFAKTFNVLYQQRTTDVNTMFKVFRRECIEGTVFRGNGFNFDIELACMIVSNGFSPMEVPVNYVARGFDEGKKINFITEFYPSYSMLYRCRFRRPQRP